MRPTWRGAPLFLGVTALASCLIVSQVAHAEPFPPWRVDAFAEGGLAGRLGGEDDGYAVGDIGAGATGMRRIVPHLNAGVGLRFSTPMNSINWGRYYNATFPLLVRLSLPLTESGHELFASGGYGLGVTLLAMDAPTLGGTLSRGTHAVMTTAWEGVLGHVFPKTKSGTQIVLQAGIRCEHSEAFDAFFQLTHLGFVRVGAVIL